MQGNLSRFLSPESYLSWALEAPPTKKIRERVIPCDHNGRRNTYKKFSDLPPDLVLGSGVRIKFRGQ